MTTEAATYVLRRKPQCEGERAACEEALKTLAAAKVPAWEVEGDVGRPLTAEELAVLNG